ncbi:MAG: redoxin domain-containing protein [Candidatus Andersenbacteria bacterium]
MQAAHQPYRLVVAFPTDLTPCCERERRAFAAKLRHLTAAGVRVEALSPVACVAHDRYVARFELDYPLVVDAEYKRLRELGWVSERTWHGKPYRHVARAAALFDAAGRLVREYQPFDLEHEVLRVTADLPLRPRGARGSAKAA